MFSGFLENLLESGILFCCATAATKTALGIIQLWFNYFAASLYKAIGVHFSREAKERDAPPPSSGCIHSCLPFCVSGWSVWPFGGLPKRPAIWHAHESAKPSGVLNSSNFLANLSQSTLSLDLAAASDSLLMHSSAEAFICTKLKHPPEKLWSVLSGEV